MWNEYDKNRLNLRTCKFKVLNMDFSFAKIEGTAGWYYNKWPGFLTVDAYRIMELFSNEHLRSQEEKSNKRPRVQESDVVQFQCTEQGSKDSVTV